jgi:Rrf2 family nitric oxide-sensitive transcriptional repressor
LISLTAEYGLRAIVALARESEPMATEKLAEVTQVPVDYLYKILQQLARHGLVRSSRGAGGGYRLVVSVAKLSVLEVLRAVDPPRRILTCPLRLREHETLLCPLHKRLDDALAVMEKTFAKTMVAELITDRRRPTPLCGTRRK